MKTRVIRMIGGKIVSDTKGDYDSVGEPQTPPKRSVVKTEEKEEDSKKKKDEKKPKKKEQEIHKSLKGLNKKILEKLLTAEIKDMDLVLNLTESDLENLKLTKGERKSLEKFVKQYLNKLEK